MPRFEGTNQDDTINGTNDPDEILGLGGNDILNGLGGDDIISGGAGDDVIDGGTGADLMVGGPGNDTIYVDDWNDVVSEGSQDGYDTILTTVDYQLTSAEVERLAVANRFGTMAINLYGTSNGDELYGNDGPNILNGGGGGDYLMGYGGDDAYWVDRADDIVWEAPGGGTDIIFTTVSFSFFGNQSQSVERLAIADPHSTGNLYLFGNDVANEITGNDGANYIRGGGGADTLIGLGGGDHYELVAGDEGDVIVEFAGGGYDYVDVPFSYKLSDNVEDLRGTHSASDLFYITLTGSRDANVIRGSDGREILDGAAGADSMIGGKGNDAYFVDNSGDVVTELVNEGNDVIFASLDWSISESAFVEKLVAIGSSNIALTGNSRANEISGNEGANILDGKLGLDILIGYGGADTFAFTTKVDGDNADLFLGFEVGIDKIALDDAVFAGLTPGELTAGAFNVGRFATDADDRILYEASTGMLFFDRDGSGPLEAQYFASMHDGLSLSASDFVVI